MSKIGVFLAEGFEEIEGLTVVDLCRRAGIDTVTVSISESREVTGAHKITVLADQLLADTDFEALDMIVLPGGMPGTRNLEGCAPLMDQLDDFYKKGKCISAICAAPSIFGHRGYLEGKNACCFPGFEEHLTGAKVSFENVEVAGNITTSRGMGTAISFSLAIIERFCGKENAEQLGKSIVYLS